MSHSQAASSGAARPSPGTTRPAALLAFLSLIFGALHFLRLSPPAAARFLVPRDVAAALSPVWAAFGLIGALAGLRLRRPLTAITGLAGFLASASYIRRIAAVTPPGPLMPRRLPRSTPRVARDLIYHVTKLPAGCDDGERPLYCDLWEPATGAPRSGIGIVYLHGSAWYLGDKAQMTGPMLAGWAAEGHVVMDVAYRMCPETDLPGMLADAWTAVAWLKTHAGEYGVHANKVVLSGTSAGGHVALIAAYTADNPTLQPIELAGRDLSVAGVFTLERARRHGGYGGLPSGHGRQRPPGARRGIRPAARPGTRRPARPRRNPARTHALAARPGAAPLRTSA